MIFGVPLTASVYAFVKRSVKRRLERKNYPTNTEVYVNLKEVVDRKEFVMMEKCDEHYLSARTILGVENITVNRENSEK